MPRYIVLTMEEKTPRPRALPSPTSGHKRFQDWAVGDIIQRKSNRHDKLQIVNFGADKMTYGIWVEAMNVTSGDSRRYSSSTLQTAFEHDPVNALDAPAQAVLPKDGTPVAFNVDLIRNFYHRKGGRKGTRIMTCNGVAYAVLEEFEAVLNLVQDAKIEDTDAEA